MEFGLWSLERSENLYFFQPFLKKKKKKKKKKFFFEPLKFDPNFQVAKMAVFCFFIFFPWIIFLNFKGPQDQER